MQTPLESKSLHQAIAALGGPHSYHPTLSDSDNLLGKQFCLQKLSLIFQDPSSVLLFSPRGTEPVPCVFGTSNEVGDGLIGSVGISHSSNWELSLRMGSEWKIFSKHMLRAASVCSGGGSQGLLPTVAERIRADLTPLNRSYIPAEI